MPERLESGVTAGKALFVGMKRRRGPLPLLARDGLPGERSLVGEIGYIQQLLVACDFIVLLLYRCAAYYMVI